MTTIEKIRAFNRFYTHIIGVLDKHILDSDFSLTEARILYEIHHAEIPITARALKDFLRIDEGYMSRSVSRLVKLGLVKKQKNPNDGREYGLHLTEKGNQQFLALSQFSNTSVSQLIQHLDSQQQTELVSLMDRIQILLRKS